MTPAQELVWKLIDQSIISEEFKELEQLLLDDPELRRYYQDALETDQSFGQIATSHQKGESEPSAFRTRVSRPGFAAAVGAVAGILSTSAVFGFVVPKVYEASPRIISVVRNAFEDPEQKFKVGFSDYANEWFFQSEYKVEQPEAVIPVEGDYVLRMDARATQKLGLAYYMIDLEDFPEVRDSLNRRIHVSGDFLADGDGVGDRYNIRIAAFSESPNKVGPIWRDTSLLFNRTLQHISRGAFTKRDESGWKELSAEMNIPEGTRTIIVSLSTGHGRHPEYRSHFLDNIDVKFVLDSPAF